MRLWAHLHTAHPQTNIYAGGSWYTTYTSVPHYITSCSRSLMLESMHPVVFDMTNPNAVTIEIYSDVISGRILSG